MATTLRCSLRDKQNDDFVRDLRHDLSVVLEFQLIDDMKSADVVIVHKKTDALPPNIRQSIQDRGIYVEYTGGGTPWQIMGERFYYGNVHELRRRLHQLAPPVTLDILRFVLDQRRVVEGALVALAQLCQGYLAAHVATGSSLPDEATQALHQMGWPFLPEGDSATMRLRAELATRQPTVCTATWWSEPLKRGTARKLDITIVSEWEERLHGAVPASLGELAQLIDNDREITPPKLVADCYLALARRLGAPQ